MSRLRRQRRDSSAPFSRTFAGRAGMNLAELDDLSVMTCRR